MAGATTTAATTSRISGLTRAGAWLPGRGLYAVPLTLSWLVLGGILILSLIVLYMSFVPGLPTQPGLTLEHWTNAARPYVVRRVLPNTLIVGVGTVSVALFFAGPLAWLLNRTALPFRNLFMALLAV